MRGHETACCSRRNDRRKENVAPRWTKNSAGRQLRNSVCVGLIGSGSELFKGNQPALLERTTWQ